jgi:hypothetical protein
MFGHLFSGNSRKYSVVLSGFFELDCFILFLKKESSMMVMNLEQGLGYILKTFDPENFFDLELHKAYVKLTLRLR